MDALGSALPQIKAEPLGDRSRAAEVVDKVTISHARMLNAMFITSQQAVTNNVFTFGKLEP